ncbi:MAG: group 1 glycosyl transferase [Verrucomicrobia bacterium]|nr:MAG: group 1 glycosyl transferase [Verrucomicrobiota bacterium]
MIESSHHQVIVSHPTGNQNCRSVLTVLEERRALAWFGTMLGFGADSMWPKLLAGSLREKLLRRAYTLPSKKIRMGGMREIIRLTAAAIAWDDLIRHEIGWASVDRVYKTLDRFVANQLPQEKGVRVVYAYEDGALETFREAKKEGIHCVYELPIAYWTTVLRLLQEEEERLPEWRALLRGKRDSTAKLDRKTEELSLADLVICPSNFVANSFSLPEKRVAVIPFGSPPPLTNAVKKMEKKIRVLFVGSLTQRKGLADLFQAIRILKRKDIELVVLGTLLAPMEFYRRQCSDFIYESPRSHHLTLKLMATCDIFVLPSLVEGRALVIQEAMSRALPIIITPNTGGGDLIEDNDCGFLVPIRSPTSIAEKISYLADAPELRRAMGERGRLKALKLTWKLHGERVWNEIKPLLHTSHI